MYHSQELTTETAETGVRLRSIAGYMIQEGCIKNLGERHRNEHSVGAE